MLKIKDDIILKELEKFDFEYNQSGYNYVKERRTKKGGWVFITIDIKTRIIKKFIHKIETYYNMPLSAEEMFDLISSGLVEKV